MFRRIRNENIIPSFDVLAFDVFCFMDGQGWMAGVSTQKSERFINGFLFTWFEPGIAFEEDDLELEIKGMSLRGHNAISLSF